MGRSPDRPATTGARKDEPTVQRRRKPATLMGSVSKRWRGASGGWRQNDGKVGYMNQGDLLRVRTVFMQRTDSRGPRTGSAGSARESRPRAEEPPQQESERP